MHFTTEIIDPFFAVPISAGKCSLADCYTILSLDDILGLNEMVAVENKLKEIEFSQAERRARRGRGG